MGIISTEQKGSGYFGHTHVLGRTRMGKSKGILGWVLQAIANGIGVALVDPHGDLFKDLLSYLALAATNIKGSAERLVVVNPVDESWSPGFNPLQLFQGEVLERKALFFADVITKIFQDDPTIVVRMRRVMRYAFMVMMEMGLTLVEIPRFLSDRDFREALISYVTNNRVRDFWYSEFPSNEREAEIWVASTLNRLEPLVDDPDFRLMFGQRKSTINLRQIMDEGKVLLVNTSKGELMDDNSRLLGAFMVAQIQQAAMTRTEVPPDLRQPFLLVLDEFQNYVSPAISTLLEETGKYRIALLLAHQYLAQLDDEKLRAAVLSQCRDTICFGVGEDDARLLFSKFFRPNLKQVKHLDLKPANWGNNLVLPSLEITWRSVAEILEYERRKFELEPRYFWHKQHGSEPKLYRTFDLPDLPIPPAMIKDLVDTSGSLFAIPKSEAWRLIEIERSKLLARLTSPSSTNSPPRLLSDEKGIPLWSD